MKIFFFYLLVVLIAARSLKYDPISSRKRFDAKTIDFSKVERVALERDISEVENNPWEKVERADPETLIHLVFALKQQNLDKLDTIFHEVSDPRHANYGQHLTRQEVNALLKPDIQTYKVMKTWLRAHSIKYTSTGSSDFLQATVPVSQAEALLQCEYWVWEHSDTQERIVRTASYTIPALVEPHLDFISPTVQFSSYARSLIEYDVNDLGQTKPEDLRRWYSISEVGAADNNKQAVTAFLGQYYHASDQETFYQTYYQKGSGTNIAVVGNEKQGLKAGIEAMLDSEYITVTGTHITTEFWSFKGRAPDNNENEPFLDWLLLVGNTTDAAVPKLFSTSYGEDESSVSKDYADRINTEFQKVATRGISILFASGDSGAAGTSGTCQAGKYFVPQWPAGSPYVTAVGATTSEDEEGVNFSSGGFSNRYAAGDWQADAVAGYLSNSKCPTSGIRNPEGRGFPDISAMGTGYTVLANGIPFPGVSGTSCSSPTAGGVFGLLNDVRLQNNQSTLGFLNPLIYQNTDAFNDVVRGSNNGCLYQSGFPCVVGWDPVTGVGTPNFAKLKEVVLNLP